MTVEALEPGSPVPTRGRLSTGDFLPVIDSERIIQARVHMACQDFWVDCEQALGFLSVAGKNSLKPLLDRGHPAGSSRRTSGAWGAPLRGVAWAPAETVSPVGSGTLGSWGQGVDARLDIPTSGVTDFQEGPPTPR